MSAFSAFNHYTSGASQPYSTNVQTSQRPISRRQQELTIPDTGNEQSTQNKRAVRLGLADAIVKQQIEKQVPQQTPKEMHEQILQEQAQEIRDVTAPKDKVATKMRSVVKTVKSSGDKIKKSDYRTLLRATNPQ